MPYEGFLIGGMTNAETLPNHEIGISVSVKCPTRREWWSVVVCRTMVAGRCFDMPYGSIITGNDKYRNTV